MANLLEQAIDCDDAERAARIIQEALGIESGDVADYVFPKTMACRSRGARSHHWRMAPGGSSSPSRAFACAGMTAHSRRFPRRTCGFGDRTTPF
jgi:hypothetical protein